jgi:hypothetical protein
MVKMSAYALANINLGGFVKVSVFLVAVTPAVIFVTVISC